MFILIEYFELTYIEHIKADRSEESTTSSLDPIMYFPPSKVAADELPIYEERVLGISTGLSYN